MQINLVQFVSRVRFYTKLYVSTLNVTEKFPMHKKKIRIQQENSYKINFPTTTKKRHNRTTVLYTKYVRNTKSYFPPEPKKTNTTPQLYGTLST